VPLGIKSYQQLGWNAVTEQVFSFGPFKLLREQRALLDGNKPIRLGSRALDVLIVLVERAGKIVSKEELIARVWQNTFVEDGNLRVHVGAVRKALRDGHAGARYIANISGRGYSFVAPIDRFAQPVGPSYSVQQSTDNIPTSLTRIIGRDAEIETLAVQVPRRRLVTVVGSGGIGKTTLASAIAQRLIDTFEHRACFVDLAQVSDASLVSRAISAALRLPVFSDDPLPSVLAFLKERKMLLVLDTCEHVVEAAAAVTEEILGETAAVHVLSTSREPLRASAEWVYRLAPFDIPATVGVKTASEALSFPAVQLLVERAAIELTDGDASIVVDICRRLDGIPLAIELAAATIELFGIRGLADRLDHRFSVLTQGRRTALPRHRTMRATLDWSYEILTEPEQWVLRQLSIFKGSFTVEAANAIAAGVEFDVPEPFDIVSNLVAKSLVAVDLTTGIVLCRLLDSTREYALEKLEQAGELDKVARCHAEYFRDFFEGIQQTWSTALTPQQSVAYFSQVDNLRAALDWAFSAAGDGELGVALTVAGVPFWMHFALIDECRVCVQRALDLVDSGIAASALQELKLNIALGNSAIMFTQGGADLAWTRAGEIAELIGDPEYRVQTLWGLWVDRYMSGDYPGALIVAKKFANLPRETTQHADIAVGERLLGVTAHMVGDHMTARAHIETALQNYSRPADRSDLIRFQYDQLIAGRSFMARIHWIQGFPDQALQLVESNVADATTLDHLPSLRYALYNCGCPVSMLARNFDAADRFIKKLIDISVTPKWITVAECFKHALVTERGDIGGPGALRAAMAGLPRNVLYYSSFLVGPLALCLNRANESAQALQVIDATLEIAERQSDRWCLPEWLRIKGEIVGTPGTVIARKRAEELLLRSLELAREQGALSWQLRTATSLARLWRAQGRSAEAIDLLSSIYDRFTEGFKTRDLVDAKTLLSELTH
jgi:predicted ATPase/DNA-binding winged helix-turn-helix (wHTH) protein